jgi:ribonucleotide reductase alpha subunit
MQATSEGNAKDDAEKVSDQVIVALEKKFQKDHVPKIEEIQDVVEEQLVMMDFAKAAKAYILYRKNRAEIREKRREIPENVARLSAESKKSFRNQLSEFIYFRSYSRWMEEEGRRETWIETVDRYVNFMKETLGGKLSDEECGEIREAIVKQEVMPSMRLMWSAGKAVKATNVSAFNCSFIAPSKPEDFAEIMYLSMCGTGVGFSVESQNVERLPQIKKQNGGKIPTHVIEDSKEGWATALTAGLKAWFGGKDIAFDFSKLRPAGARLKTMGGQSSGPEPLRALLDFARRKILSKQGKRLSSIDVHDIICKIGEIVVAGGVRRSALISLSDLDDTEMRDAKKGQFYVTEPQRSMANNSAVYNEKPSAAQFLKEWLALAESGTGERGIFNRGSLLKQIPERRKKVFSRGMATCGTNPCVTGDTLVYVADGRGHVPIKLLAEEGMDVPVFCRTNRGSMAIRYMRNPRRTGRSQSVYKITLDDGSIVKVTAEHKFLLKSGEYKKVKDLVFGDSLTILTRFEASIKDVFKEANSRSQDYWWINNGLGNNTGEHRLIAEFHHNAKIPKGYIVHHKDRNTQNNSPRNLEILSKNEHDNLHGNLMMGDNNPMRRAREEWSGEKWNDYRRHVSDSVAGDKNGRFSGISNDDLRARVLTLTAMLGRRFSHRDWVAYAKEHDLPQHFSKWRNNHLGGLLGLAKWAAAELEIEHIDADPRVVSSYKKHAAEGYNCAIENGRVILLKRCEVCGVEFGVAACHREIGVCSISCGLKKKWVDLGFRATTIEKIRLAHQERKAAIREKQAKIYSALKFELGRPPMKSEWLNRCRAEKISVEISRKSSPFRAYNELQEFASLYNHKIVSVEFCGYEDVYNGTVDEFHNFFIGGFESSTRNGKKKFAYLNNLQCGEITLKSKEFCNLTEVVARAEDTEGTLLGKMRLATIIGTYQSMLTNFPFLSKDWQKNCEEERLLGVSITGQWDSPAVRNAATLKKLRELAVETNKIYAAKMGINQSLSVTCVKPSGTVSQLVDASSGLHARHAQYYIRRVRINATDPLFQMLKDQKVPYYPEVGQSTASANVYVFEFPVKAPENAVKRNDLTALQQLEYWRLVKENYTEHNPSVTISVGVNEWIEVANWLYENWDMIGGLSFLPRDDHAYMLAPYEEITKERYEEMTQKFPTIDFAQIIIYEKEDATQGARELACVSGVCEVEEETSSNTVVR